MLRDAVEALLAQPVSGEFRGVPAVTLAGEVASPAAVSVLTVRRIGVYQVGDRLGVGGMGEVCRARDMRLGRDVAIKDPL